MNRFSKDPEATGANANDKPKPSATDRPARAQRPNPWKKEQAKNPFKKEEPKEEVKEEVKEETTTKNKNEALEEAKKNLAVEAGKAAATSAGQTAKTCAIEFKNYIVENPAATKVFGVIGAASLVVSSIFTVANPLTALAPTYYLLNAFNICFGFALLLVEGPPSWKWCGARVALFKYASFFCYPAGRAFFYLYVSCLVCSIATTDTKLWYLYLIFAVLMVSAVLQFVSLCKSCKKKPQEGHAELVESPVAGNREQV